MLPCVFEEVVVHSVFKVIEATRGKGFCEFELLGEVDPSVLSHTEHH